MNYAIKPESINNARIYATRLAIQGSVEISPVAYFLREGVYESYESNWMIGFVVFKFVVSLDLHDDDDEHTYPENGVVLSRPIVPYICTQTPNVHVTVQKTVAISTTT